MNDFTESTPTLDSYWRAIILFGRNVASYKFALARALLDLKTEGERVRMEEIAPGFATAIAAHLKDAPKQGTSPSSRFLDACRQYNAGEITLERLVDRTVALGFNNVIDAFHVVNQAATPVRFFRDERAAGGGIVLTPEFFDLRASMQAANLAVENEARWRLVETAWAMNLSPRALMVEYESAGGLYIRGASRRIDLTGCAEALNGYQKGRCFYCFADITVGDSSASTADIDHYFPHVLGSFYQGLPVDGIWNLVLACQRCNRGENGKFARVPAISYLERLERRNNYLIDSHHPLRETIINQTGSSAGERRAFLAARDREAIGVLIHRWRPAQEGPAWF